MTSRFRFDDVALADIKHIADWYDGRALGVGTRFIEEVRRIADLVAVFPSAYVIAHRSVRKVHLHRFPYFIVYEVVDDEEFVILGVLADAQHPRQLLDRLGDA
jgi:plasmid stabilization system protein ParE